MFIKKRNTEIWMGTHNGVDFEINKFKFGYRDSESWTYYLIIHLDRIPKKYKPESLWMKKMYDSGATKRGSFRYYNHPVLSAIEFHGGITWYSKEAGFDKDPKIIKIGCDYQHSWDEGHVYDLMDIQSDVINSIDSFLRYCPDYLYWCCGNGKLYNKKDGIITGNGDFHSFEYFDKSKAAMDGGDIVE
jgi:hypothetical protein